MHTNPWTRRQFLAGSVATLAAGALGKFARAQVEPNDPGYSFPLIGDLHFDRLAHHDMDWLMAEKPNDLRQIERYSRITEEVLPALLTEVREQVQALRRPVPFVVQVGDLVEGLCGRPDLAQVHCEEAIALVEDAKLGAPMLLTKGNHDITGPGAKEAFNNVLLPSMPKEMRTRQLDANFVVEHGGDAPIWLVAYDCYSDHSLPWLEKTLADHDPAHARLLFLVHQPVVPYTARCWHEFNKPAEAEQRQRLLDLLARHKAIVLNGHLHKYGCLTREVETANGAIRQLAINSVIPDPAIEMRDELTGSAQYGPAITQLEERFSPDSLKDRQALLTAESAHVTDYHYADAPGYAMVHVRPDRIEADLYLGLGKRRWKTVTLMPPV